MWIRKHSKQYKNVQVDDIWKIWTDVNNWPAWHDDLEYCLLEGPFIVGSHFILKPKNGPKVKIKLIDIQEKKEFTDCTEFFGAKMYNTHSIEKSDKGIILHNKLIVTGILKWLWIWLVAHNVAKTVPTEMDALVNLARSKNG